MADVSLSVVTETSLLFCEERLRGVSVLQLNVVTP